MHRQKKKVFLELSLSVVVFILLVAAIFTLKPTLTGLSVYEEAEEKVWDFSNPQEYSYNPELLSLSPENVQLVPITITETWTTTEIQEIYLTATSEVNTNNDNSEDHLEKLEDLDDKIAEIEQNNRRLDFTLSQSLEDNDIISFYLKEINNGETEVYLCLAGTSCELSDYGTLQYTGAEGWYNLTLSNIDSTISSFSLNPDKKLKIDAIKAFHFETIKHTLTNITYPAEAEIETLDFSPTALKSWNIFNAEENLQEQQINYFYSSDLGANWLPLVSGEDLSALNSSQIRFKTQLLSDQKETPLLQQLKLNYISEYSECEENWESYFSPCLVNNTQLKMYMDSNECGTTIMLPADNNTIISCDYCALNNCTEESEPNTIINFDFQEEAEAWLEIEIEGEETPEISVTQSFLSDKGTPAEKLALNKYWEINASREIIFAQMKLYYTDEEISAINLSEESLRGYYYNETSLAWEELLSAINLEENYVKINTTHFSTYGIFGDALEKAAETIPETTPELPASSSSGGGGGGGSSRRITLTKETILPVETTSQPITINGQEENTPQLAAETECNYVLEITLPEKVSLLQKDKYEGQITNRGNCLIQKLDLYLSPEIKDLAQFTPQTITDLAPQENTTFILIRKSETDSGLFSFLTGNTVVDQFIGKTVEGKVSLEGSENQEILFAQDLNLELEVFSPEKVVRTAKIAFPSIGSVLLISSLILIIVRRKRFLKNNNN